MVKISVNISEFVAEFGYKPKYVIKDCDGSIWFFEHRPFCHTEAEEWMCNSGRADEYYGEGYKEYISIDGVKELYWEKCLFELDDEGNYTDPFTSSLEEELSKFQSIVDAGKEAEKRLKSLKKIKELQDMILDSYGEKVKSLGYKITFVKE